MDEEDKNNLIKIFVKNFIQKNRRERCYFEIINPKKRSKFTDRLNHLWETIFDMRYLKKIDLDDPEYVKKQLGLHEKDICYIISNTNDDDNFFTFGDIFMEIYRGDFGAIILNSTGDKLLLVTEPAKIGMSIRFIGERRRQIKYKIF